MVSEHVSSRSSWSKAPVPRTYTSLSLCASSILDNALSLRSVTSWQSAEYTVQSAGDGQLGIIREADEAGSSTLSDCPGQISSANLSSSVPVSTADDRSMFRSRANHEEYVLSALREQPLPISFVPSWLSGLVQKVPS